MAEADDEIEYVCMRCGRRMKRGELKVSAGYLGIEYKCRHCSYKVLYKPRRRVAKMIRAI